MTTTIEHADAVQWAREYRGPLHHALLCDPPYALNFMGKRWDSQVAFNPDTWAAFANVLHPGAFGMAFASSRGWHRLAVAIEDAGFVIHPSIFGWAFGSGFPKAQRIDTQIDKAAGVEREIVGKSNRHDSRAFGNGVGDADYGTFAGGVPDVTAPATPLARAWAGHRYGLQCLKPALEPIIVFQKPYAGRAVDCITTTGAGAMWIDGARVATDGRPHREKLCDLPSSGIYGDGLNGSRAVGETTIGRWPANLIIADEAAAARLDEMSGERPSVGHYTDSLDKPEVDNSGMFGNIGNPRLIKNKYAGDTGGASRFFYNVREAIDDADPLHYCAKASRRERDAGLEGMPIRGKPSGGHGNKEADPISIAMGSLREFRNPHPTIKPIALTEYLARLLLPPAEYAPRRLFVPFAGAGSECIGAMRAGWDEVVGVELNNDDEHNYVDIARARVEYWGYQAGLFPDFQE